MARVVLRISLGMHAGQTDQERDRIGLQGVEEEGVWRVDTNTEGERRESQLVEERCGLPVRGETAIFMFGEKRERE